MCCAYSTSTSTPATQLHSQRNTMLINQHKQYRIYSIYIIQSSPVPVVVAWATYTGHVHAPAHAPVALLNMVSTAMAVE